MELCKGMAQDDILSRKFEAPGLDAPYETYISPEDMQDFHNLDELSAGSITWYFG